MLSFPFSITLERTLDYTMSTVTNLVNRLEKGEILLMDGGIGTELERLGAPMDHATWCAVALQTHPHLVKEVHRSYVSRQKIWNSLIYKLRETFRLYRLIDVGHTV